MGIRYVYEKDIQRPWVRTTAKRALMTDPYIDEQAEKIAWNGGETLPLIAKFLDDGSVVVSSKKTGYDYMIPKSIADEIMIEKIR
ncbi:MAG: hypothetical protein IKI86_05135 [Firmicutes bacterium]|nr:hypothetical protein [Bacillota bacterium]